MVIINYKDAHNVVHIQSFLGAKYWYERPNLLCHFQHINDDETENVLVETRESPTCEHCINHIKYAVIIAKYCAFPTDTI